MSDEHNDLDEQSESEREYTPAYVPIQTLVTFVESLDPKAIPRSIDRSMMPNYSGGVQRKLMSALTFLGLTRPGGETTQQLHELVETKGSLDQFKAIFARIINAAYAKIIGDLDVGTASAKQLTDAFRSAGVEGNTLNEAIRFYVKARQTAELPVSQWISAGKLGAQAAKTAEKNGTKGRTKRPTPSAQEPEKDRERETAPPPGEPGTSPGFVALPLYPYPRRVLVPVDLLESECDTAEKMMRAYAESVSGSAKGTKD